MTVGSILALTVWEVLLDGTIVVAAVSAVFYLVRTLWRLKSRQDRLIRDIRGAEDDDTRSGLAVEQQTAFQRLNGRLDELEDSIDEGFAEARESREDTRDRVDELQHSLARVEMGLHRSTDVEWFGYGREYPQPDDTQSNTD